MTLVNKAYRFGSFGNKFKKKISFEIFFLKKDFFGFVYIFSDFQLRKFFQLTNNKNFCYKMFKQTNMNIFNLNIKSL